LEASALTYASRRGLIARRSPLLRLQGDERLVAMLRRGNDGAFETIVDRYQGRLLGFCRQMLGSTEDAEDVLQEVFVNAHRAILADNREINLRPWLYRIARNRCLNHLRKPVADGQDSMDMHPITEAANTHERVQNREEFRQLLCDVEKLPETQRSALLLREMDALSYEEIAQAMETTVPSVKSLLVRARIALAEASQARQLTCGEVRLHLAEAAEGLRKADGPIRRHVRECDGCGEFRSQLRSDAKALAAIFPVGPLLLLKATILSKLGLGGAGAGAGASGGAGAAGAGGASAGGAAIGGAGGAAGGVSAGGIAGSAIGAKAVASVVTAAVITAGAVEVKDRVVTPDQAPPPPSRVAAAAPAPPPVVTMHDALAGSGPAAHAAHQAAKPADTQPVNDPAADPVATAPGTSSTTTGKHHKKEAADTSTTPAPEQVDGVTILGSGSGSTTTTPSSDQPPPSDSGSSSGGTTTVPTTDPSAPPPAPVTSGDPTPPSGDVPQG
jgi:RNA polymerase sigma factor (sigma-70 family)